MRHIDKIEDSCEHLCDWLEGFDADTMQPLDDDGYEVDTLAESLLYFLRAEWRGLNLAEHRSEARDAALDVDRCDLVGTVTLGGAS